MAMNAEAAPFVPNTDDKADDAGAEGKGDAVASDDDEDAHTGGMSGTRLWRPTYQGRIRSYSQQKGFGFIDCQESLRAFGRDVFIHRFQMDESKLNLGQDVIFEVELNKTGCPQARNVRSAAAMDQGDMGGMGGWGGMGMGGMGMDSSAMGFGGQQGMCSGMGAMGGKGAFGGDWGKDGSGASGQNQGQPDTVEEMLRNAQGSSRLWEIIETHGHTFQKGHVVTALYQMGLCRQYERRNPQSNLSATLAECLSGYSTFDFTADEMSRVMWSFAIMEELHEKDPVRSFAMKLGEEAVRRCHEFTPDKMTKFVSSLSRLVKTAEDDELVGRLTSVFSDYALGQGSMPRFPPDELRTWASFLQEVSGGPKGGPPDGSMQAKGAPPFAQQQAKGGAYGPGPQPMGGYAPVGPPGAGPWPGKGGFPGGPGMPGMPGMSGMPGGQGISGGPGKGGYGMQQGKGGSGGGYGCFSSSGPCGGPPPGAVAVPPGGGPPSGPPGGYCKGGGKPPGFPGER